MRSKRKVLLLLAIALAASVLVLLIVHAGQNSAFLQDFGGYRLYAAKEPFSILVGKDFPASRSFLVATEKSPVVFSLDESKDEKTSATVSIGTQLSVHVRTDAKNKPFQLWILRAAASGGDEALWDLDLSGTWDMKIILKQNKRSIWVDNAWHDVEKISGLDKEPVTASSSENHYFFDRATGDWKIEQGNVQQRQ